MKTEILFKYFGGRDKAIPIIAKQLNIRKNSIYKWNVLVPIKSAIILASINKGLSLNAKDYNLPKIMELTRKYK